MKTNAPALLSGNARAWRYTDFDDEGRETLRLDQLDGSPAPEDGEYSADALPPDTSFTMTVSDYAPLAGDTAAAADRATPRTVSRYAVYAGHLPVLIGRTWRTIVRGLRDGIPTVSVRTERAHAQGAALGDPANAVTETVSYEADAPGVPLLLRGRPVAETGEDGVTTHWIHDCGTWDAATRMFTPGTGTGHLRTLSFHTSPEAPQGIPLVATGTLTVEDAVHGNLLFEANLIQVGAGNQGLGIGHLW